MAVGEPLRPLAGRLGLAWSPSPPDDGLALIETPQGLAIAGDYARYGKPLSVDFTTGSGMVATHAYSARGTFPVRLTVRDPAGMMATLSGCEMGLDLAGVPHQRGGVDKAAQYLASTSA